MSQRFDITSLSPDLYKAMFGVHLAVNDGGPEATVLELVRMRVSQINGCAFCIGMHADVARKLGIGDDRLLLLPAWREASALFGERERAALVWAEALTRLANGDVPDAAYEAVRAVFSDKEISALSFAVAEINAWNRLMIASRTPPQLAAKAG